MTDLAVIVLAAGKGTRMKSDLPKVLHKLAGKPMVGHLLEAVKGLDPERVCVVVGHGAELVQDYARSVAEGVLGVPQGEQKGTGHAVQVCEGALKGFKGDVLIVYGDAPLIQTADLALLVDAHAKSGASLTALTTRVEDPFGFGRIVRDGKGSILKIVEEKEASEVERAIDEVNPGIYCVKAEVLWSLLADVKPSAAKGEYYLTDILEIAKGRGLNVQGVESDGGWGLLGVNDKIQLALAEDGWQERERLRWMAEGVGMVDPASVWFSHDTELAAGVELEPHVVFGEGVKIAAGVQVKAFSHLTGCEIGEGCVVGPFARLRPGTKLAADVHVGNFVEVKNSKIGKGTKANHLSYIGDADVGAEVNFGAGTLVANYNRKTGVKYRTTIGEGASLGAHTVLVAPVMLGKRATTGAGTVVRADVEDEALVVTKAETLVKRGYAKK